MGSKTFILNDYHSNLNEIFEICVIIENQLFYWVIKVGSKSNLLFSRLPNYCSKLNFKKESNKHGVNTLRTFPCTTKKTLASSMTARVSVFLKWCGQAR
jgi:hypothetical protein